MVPVDDFALLLGHAFGCLNAHVAFLLLRPFGQFLFHQFLEVLLAFLASDAHLEVSHSTFMNSGFVSTEEFSLFAEGF